MKKAMVLITAIFTLGLTVFAAGDYGTPGEFLSWGAGARALGMGKAFTGLADDVSAIYYNPAGLAQQNPYQFTFLHVMLFENTMYDFAAASVPFSGIGTIGLAYVRLGSSEFDGRNKIWQATGKFDISNQAVLLSYARDIFGPVSGGINIKLVTESVDKKSSIGYGVDAGFFYVPAEFLSVGLSLINALPPVVKLNNSAETFPVSLKFGIAGHLIGDRIIPTLDLEQEFSKKAFKLRAGLEINPIDDLSVRAGKDETELTFGIGYRVMKNYKIDYSASMQELGWTHRFAFSLAFGGFDVSMKAEPKIFSPVGVKKTTTLSIYAQTKYPAVEWELNIMNEDGDAVRSYSGDENPPPSIIWDGKDDRGLPVTDGEYRCVLKVKDKNGKVIESSPETVKISSRLPMTPGSIELEE